MVTGSPRRRQPERPFEVYDGTLYCGRVAEVSGGRWEAFGADARALGRFPDAKAAADAVLAAWRKSGGGR